MKLGLPIVISNVRTNWRNTWLLLPATCVKRDLFFVLNEFSHLSLPPMLITLNVHATIPYTAQNILLTSKDDDAHIKLTDFGFARRTHNTPYSLTSRCGTPTFVAPEILKNIPHDERSDLWSVGVIVYLLLVGYPPFMKETQAELFQQIRSCDWKFQSNDWENISEEAKDLISHLLVADPEQRWTAEQALKSAWIEQDPEEGTADSLNPVDLMRSIEALRERRERLRQFATPVLWRDDQDDHQPVHAAIKIQEPIADEEEIELTSTLTTTKEAPTPSPKKDDDE